MFTTGDRNLLTIPVKIGARHGRDQSKGIGKGLKEPPCFLMILDQILGMPLDSYRELSVVHLQGFGIAFFGPCGNTQARSGLIHDLMMPRVHEVLSWSYRLGQPGSGFDTDRVSLGYAWLDVTVHMLRERPSLHDVEQLHAAADCQHWEVLLERRFEQPLFQDIPLVVGLVVCFVRFLTKEPGVHVDPAGEQQTIQPFDRL